MQLFRTKGQKFLHCPRTKGQRDKFKILPWEGTGRDSLSKSGPGHGTGQLLFFCQNPGRDNCYFFPMTFFLQYLFLFLNIIFLFHNILSCIRMFFSCFRTSFSFCPRTSWDKGVCPWIFAPALVPGQRDKEILLNRDKGTMGRSVPDCTGLSRDVPSLRNPTLDRCL